MKSMLLVICSWCFFSSLAAQETPEFLLESKLSTQSEDLPLQEATCAVLAFEGEQLTDVNCVLRLHSEEVYGFQYKFSSFDREHAVNTADYEAAGYQLELTSSNDLFFEVQKDIARSGEELSFDLLIEDYQGLLDTLCIQLLRPGQGVVATATFPVEILPSKEAFEHTTVILKYNHVRQPLSIRIADRQSGEDVAVKEIVQLVQDTIYLKKDKTYSVFVNPGKAAHVRSEYYVLYADHKTPMGFTVEQEWADRPLHYEPIHETGMMATLNTHSRPSATPSGRLVDYRSLMDERTGRVMLQPGTLRKRIVQDKSGFQRQVEIVQPHQPIRINPGNTISREVLKKMATTSRTQAALRSPTRIAPSERVNSSTRAVRHRPVVRPDRRVTGAYTDRTPERTRYTYHTMQIKVFSAMDDAHNFTLRYVILAVPI